MARNITQQLVNKVTLLSSTLEKYRKHMSVWHTRCTHSFLVKLREQTKNSRNIVDGPIKISGMQRFLGTGSNRKHGNFLGPTAMNSA